MGVQAGVWQFDGRVTPDFLNRVTQSLVEYGTDGEMTYVDGPIGILYRTFHTTPESRLERQPYASRDGNVITWDGRLDNREELISIFGDELDDDKSDVAIVAAAFDRWRTDCFSQLSGDWALSIWSSQKRELTLARDYAGIRHLYYYRTHQMIMWCSHLAPLALCGDRFSLNEEYVAGYITLWPEAQLTPYGEIRSVPPGSFFTLRGPAVSVRSYWAFTPEFKTSYKTDAEYEEQYRYLFRQAVRRRLRSESPILADLSGGLDSSSVVCMADDILMKEGAATPSVDTFSVSLRDEPGEEDSGYFTKVEQKRGRAGHKIELCTSNSTSLFTYLRFVATPGFVGRPEEVAAKSDIIRRGNYRVVLSGTAGDEMLGQALDPRIQLADLLRGCRLCELRKQIRAWSLLLRRPAIHLLSDAFFLQLPIFMRRWNSTSAQVESWITRKFADRQHLSDRQMDAAEGPWLWAPGVRDWHQTLMTLARQMSKVGPYSAEVRYPYLDQQLVEFLTSIPTEQLLRPGQRRSLMRRALTDLLPPEILARRTKSSVTRYFSVVLERHWLQLEGICRAPLLAGLGYVDQREFYSSLLDAKNGKLSLHFLRLFRALSLELWLRDVISRGVLSI